MTRERPPSDPGKSRSSADPGSPATGSPEEGSSDVGSVLDAVEAALGGASMRNADPSDRAAACRAAAKVAIRRALRGEETGTSLGVERLQSLISVLDDLTDRIARDGHEPDEDHPAPRGMP